MNALTVEQAHTATSNFSRHRLMMRIPAMFLSPAYRQAAYAVYAFFRTADDLIDEQHVTLDQFHAWREQSQQPVEKQTDPFMIAWTDIRARYGIPLAYEQAALDGLELDLACHRYETLDELKKYCYGAATAPALVSASVVGFRPGVTLEQARPYIESMGIALQLTNIIRDVNEDLSVGRIYLPKAELAAFGLTYADIEAKCYDDRFKRFMQHFARLAKDHYAAGWPILDLWTGSLRLAAGFGFSVYRTILNEAEAHNFDVFNHRVRIPGWKIFWLLATKWPAIYWTKSADRYFR